jgi:hypothetical protein
MRQEYLGQEYYLLKEQQTTAPSIVETKIPESVNAIPSKTGGAGSSCSASLVPSSLDAIQNVPGP